MACTLLVLAQDAPRAGVWKKGYPVVCRPADHVWGSQELLPQFIRIDIPDADQGDLDSLLASQRINYEVKVQSETASGWVLRIQVAESSVSRSGSERRLFPADVRNWSEQEKLVPTHGINHVTVMLPKHGDLMSQPGQLQEVARNFNDLFSFDLSPVRFFFSEADVDAALPSGILTLSLSQVMTSIQDKLQA